MELLLGSLVSQPGARGGRLAGFELEPSTRRVRRIIYSPDGDLGPQSSTQPVAAIASVHDDGELELNPAPRVEPMPVVADVVLLSRATRLMNGGRPAGRLVGLEIDRADRTVVAAFARAHWLSRRHAFDAARLNFAVPGEIQIGPTSGSSRAA